MDEATNHPNSLFTVLMVTVNGLFTLVVIMLSVVTFFAIMDILVAIALFYVLRKPEISVQDAYYISTVRNFWGFFGGAMLLGFVIGAIDYFTNRLTHPKTIRYLLPMFVVEIIIIGISYIN